jgi:hypothetical protein
MPSGVPQRLIIKALKESGGILSPAAKAVNLSPSTMSRRVSSSPKLKALVDKLKEQNVDVAESKLLEKIAEGNMSAVIFYLKTQAKDRGYIERQEQTGKDGKAMQVEMRDVDMPPRPSSYEEWQRQNSRRGKLAEVFGVTGGSD